MIKVKVYGFDRFTGCVYSINKYFTSKLIAKIYCKLNSNAKIINERT